MLTTLHAKDLFLLLAGLLGSVLVGYVFYRLSVRGPRPMLQYRVTSAVESHVLGDRVELLHDGAPVARIVELEIFFWNRGRATLAADSVPQSDPIVLRFETGGKILAAVRSETTRKGCGIEIATTGDSEAKIQFNFLEFHDGAMFLVAHTAAFPYPSVSGSVKGTSGDVDVLFDPFELFPEHPYGGSRARKIDWLFGLVLLVIAVDNLASPTPAFDMPVSGLGAIFWVSAAAVTAVKAYHEFGLRGGRIPRRLRQASKREARARRLRQLQAGQAIVKSNRNGSP